MTEQDPNQAAGVHERSEWRVPQHIIERNSQAHVFPQLPWNMRVPKNTDIREIEYY